MSTFRQWVVRADGRSINVVTRRLHLPDLNKTAVPHLMKDAS